ncbi:MAG: hypothetical protein GC159_23175 [Phycisphaera sp.]|nr:hypothetical protein [Phycisphaera sp.]
MIEFECPTCAHHYEADDKFAGVIASCDECHQVFTVPDGLLRMRCPHCKTKHAIPRSYIGKVIRCNKCNETVFVEGEDKKQQAVAHDPNEPAPWDDALSHVKASTLKQTFIYRFRVVIDGEEVVAAVEADSEDAAREQFSKRGLVIESTIGPDLDPHPGDIPLAQIPRPTKSDTPAPPSSPLPAFKPHDVGAASPAPDAPPDAPSASEPAEDETFCFRAVDAYGNRCAVEVVATTEDAAKARLIGQNYHSLERVEVGSMPT